ncbi:hypothetical protein [Alloprevotella rava]|uniref:Uncharacterized protein n=1 Tax=Alloprevotella rava TaxID=671218 RepID=A0A7W5UHM6_9BACT|nr:hypothetical protein [Alloprevotella rava]MBB3701587.1 hypothetical protein [Alloprevotella rava]
MTDSLPHRTSPREDTLKFLREFARFYQPVALPKKDDTDSTMGSFSTPLC